MSSKKGKTGKPVERKDSKKGDDASSATEPKEESHTEEVRPGSGATEANIVEEPPAPPPPPPEPPIDDAVLNSIIVSRYNGAIHEKSKKFIGVAEAEFHGGHYYRGHFQNGMMHGKGYYRWADGTTYEGEFYKNEIKGRGIYKWPDSRIQKANLRSSSKPVKLKYYYKYMRKFKGHSLYEGEVEKGIRHGFGTFRFENNTKSYQGEWHFGKKHGRGRMDYDPDGISYYDGEWDEGLRHGMGTRRYPSGNMYTGMWYRNQRHGEGNMRWLDRDQMYDGQWEDGVPNGYGQHIWFLKRVAGSQYPMRNMYIGDFVRGARQGYGVYHYANGARYEGEWLGNYKHGKGKFVFKNGRIYEGLFDKDHIVEYPDLNFDPLATPDPNLIRTRTPLPSDQMSARSNESINTYSPSFQLEVEHVFHHFELDARALERTQVMHVAMRDISEMRKIYSFYSSLGFDESPDNTFTMTRIQLWRFMKDCKLHVDGPTLWEMDSWLHYNRCTEDVHNPFDKILFREFMNYVIVLAYNLYCEEVPPNETVLAWCLSHLMNTKVLKNACSVQGYIYRELRRAVNALVHADGAFEVFQTLLAPDKKNFKDECVTMRQFLLFMKDFGLINENLTAQAMIDILAFDDPNVKDEDGLINLELKMTYLEFFEALVGSAQEYVTEEVVNDPTTPRSESAMTAVQSQASGANSRLPSNSAGAETPSKDVDERTATPRSAAGSRPGTETAPCKRPTPSPSSPRAADTISPVPLSDRKSQHTGGMGGKSTSFLSSHNSEPLEQQDLTARKECGSPAPPSEGVPDEAVPSEAGEFSYLDEGTRQFNFWTHQVHIFFVRKFFPAANKYLFLRQAVREHYPEPETPVIKEPSMSQTEVEEEDEKAEEVCQYLTTPTLMVEVTA